MGTRDGAIARATGFFDNGAFRDRLAELVAIPSTSQDPGHEADVHRYLDTTIRPWLERMDFSATIHPNPRPGFGPILTAERHEDQSRPTVLTYGHGDTVRGLDYQWRAGLDPWRLTEAFVGMAVAAPTTRVSTRSTSPHWRPCWPSAAANSAST